MEASPPPPPPPPQPPVSEPVPSPYETEIATRLKVQRSKLIWRTFMIANLGLGAVMFFKAKQRDLAEKYHKSQLKVEQPPPSTPAPPPPQHPSDASLLDYDYEPDIVPSSPNSEPLFIREPISNDEKREVFQWMLEEKRRIQPKDREEKRRIDQDKAVLKQFIRAESIPPM